MKNKDFRLLVLYTGGTIGMEDGPYGLVPSDHFINVCKEIFIGHETNYIIYDPPIDSSCINIQHWNRLIKDLDEHRDHIDGALILHGTDTMAYTSSVLSSVLKGYGKPIVLTGAQKPWTAQDSDAQANLYAAYWALTSGSYFGVSIAFQRKIWRGSTVRKVDAEGFDGFSSPNDYPLAEVGLHPFWYPRDLVNDENLESSYCPIFLGNYYIPVLFLMPGVTLDWFAHACHANLPDGIIMMAFGNGNAPKNDPMLSVVKTMIDKERPVWLISQVQKGRVDPIYAASHIWLASGVSPKGGMTPEYAYAQMMVMLSRAQAMVV
jgi:L-asparaginase